MCQLHGNDDVVVWMYYEAFVVYRQQQQNLGEATATRGAWPCALRVILPVLVELEAFGRVETTHRF